MQLDIPDDVLDSLELPPGRAERELRIELALALYASGRLSGGQARRLADVTRVRFWDLLGERDIPRHYTEKNLEEDIEYARRSGRGG